MRIYRILATAFFVALISLNASAQQGNSIRGKVRNSSGVNMSQVIVSIETGNGSPFAQTATNNEGDFFFGGLTDTSYVLVISAPDYNPVSEHVDFVNRTGPDNPGESRTIDITLSPKSGVGSKVRPGASFVQDVPKAARDAFEKAVKLAREHKSEEALAWIGEAIKIFPDYFEAHFARSTELLKSGRLNEAIAELERARQINPKERRVFQMFGVILMRQGKYAVAAATFAEAARLDPTNPQNLLMRADALIEHASAIDSKSKSAAAERDYAFADAEKALMQAFELSGKNLTTVYLHKAKLYERQGERGRAAEELEQYLRKTPDVKNADGIRAEIKKLRGPVRENKSPSTNHATTF